MRRGLHDQFRDVMCSVEPEPSDSFQINKIILLYTVLPVGSLYSLDWTTGLAFHNNVGYQNKGGVNEMQPNKCSMLS